MMYLLGEPSLAKSQFPRRHESCLVPGLVPQACGTYGGLQSWGWEW